MKTLATCKPSEFLVQANKIRKSVEKWLKDTKILEIRAKVPQYEKITDDMDDAEKARIAEANKALRDKAAMENLSEILDAVLEKYPKETLEVMALVCFIEPKDADKHSVMEYLAAISEIMSNKDVISFFGSLMQWGQIDFSS